MIFENHHEGIVTKEEYETVQMLLAKDTRIAPGENRLYLFGGLLSCGDCGSNLIRRTTVIKEKRQFFISVLLTIKRRINVPDIVSEKMC